MNSATSRSQSGIRLHLTSHDAGEIADVLFWAAEMLANNANELEREAASELGSGDADELLGLAASNRGKAEVSRKVGRRILDKGMQS